MADIDVIVPIPRLDPIVAIGKDELVEGGLEGAANRPVIALANQVAYVMERTYAKTDVDDIAANLQEMISAAEKGVLYYATQTELLAARLGEENRTGQARDTGKLYLWKITSAAGVTPVVWGWVDTGLSDLEKAAQTAASISAIGDYLTEESKKEIAKLDPSTTKYLVAKAIKKIAVIDPVDGKKYRIGSVLKNASTSGSRIVINDETGAISSIVIPAENPVSGLKEYDLGGIRKGKVLIDWDAFPAAVSLSNLELFFNNDKYLPEFLSASARAGVDDLLVPDWILLTQAQKVRESSQAVKKIIRAIKGVSIIGASDSQVLRLATVCKNHPTYGSRFLIINENGVQVTNFVAYGVVKSGFETVSLTAQNSSGITGTISINWDELDDSLFSDGNSLILINPKSVNVAAALGEVEEVKKQMGELKNIPEWLNPDYKNNFGSHAAGIKSAAMAIKGIEVLGVTNGTLLRFATICKNDPVYANRLIVMSGTTIVSRYDSPNTVIKTGVELISLAPVGSSGITVNLTIDWDQVPQGTPVSGSNFLYINNAVRDYAKAKPLSEKNAVDIAVLQGAISSVSSGSKAATKPYKVAIAGSSITWGGGYLGQSSYVGIFEQILRNQYAKTLHASSIAPTATTLTGEDFYLGSIKRISGLNSEVSFSLEGDELSISYARERENAGACLVELLIDDVVYDTFDTFTKQSVSRAENFTGNGSTIKFNLDGCFTYDHVVTVAGVAKKGKVNIQSSGASIPADDDYMVIRRYDSINNRVVHSLWFKTAPTGDISVTYKQGENIRHLRGTIDRSGAGFNTALENPYGDGSTAYDPANPSAVSSGFGFRQSDERSVKTWKFSESKARSFKLRIKALHSSATGATPYLDLNFVTNRMHHVMNAGIGGWSAGEFINHSIKINTIQEVINFNPDIVLIESCTNDDWATGLFKAHITKTGLTAAQLLAEPTANYFTAISGTASNKTVNDVRLPIVAIDRDSLTLNTGVIDSEIKPGDIVVIGEYGCNHKRVAVRTIKSYDSATKKITFNRAISVSDFYQVNSLSELMNSFAMVYSAPSWVDQNKQLIDLILDALPDCKINVATSGIPHFYLRKLFGYRELAQKVALDKRVGFVDYFKASFDFQYSQRLTVHQTITSTGADSYSLSGMPYTFPNPVVLVNGVEHKSFKIEGGLSKHWADGVTDPTLSNTSNYTRPFKLIFEKDVPVSGAEIVVKKSTTAWANDYCHPTGPQGFLVLGQAAAKILKDAI